MAALVISPVAVPANFTITPGGPPVTVTVSTAGGTSTASFTGTAGHRISLNFSSVTITSARVSILKPGGADLLTPFTVTRSGFFLNPRTLPTTGTYRIVVDPKVDYTGRAVLTLYDVPDDPTAPITADGTPATVTTTTPGQNGTFTFSGIAGHRISINLTDVTYGSGKLRILNPDSTLLYPTALVFSPGGGFLEPKTLPATGTYTIVVDPQLLAVGQATLQLYDVADDATYGPAVLDGSATNAATSSPGQNAYVTFTTTVPNQRVSFLFSNSSYGSMKASVLRPDATALFTSPVLVTALDTFVDTKVLATVGQYKVLVNPQRADTGSVDVKIYNVPADATGAVATNGTPTTAVTGTPGQNALLTFSGNAGQRVSVEVVGTGNTYDSAKVSILKPDGTLLFSPALTVGAGIGAFHEPVALPTTSTQYKVKVDPQGVSTGQLDVKLYIVPADVGGALSPSVAKPVTIAAAGQNAVLTYAGTAGQRFSLNLTAVTLGSSSCCSAKVKVTKPDGTTLVFATSFGTDGKFIDATAPLPVTGTYRITIDPQGAATGSVTVTLYVVTTDASSTSPALTTGGVSASVTTVNPGQNGRISFTGVAGQRFAFKLLTFAGAGACNVKVSVVAPDGTTKIVFPTCSTEGQWFNTTTNALTAQTYKVFVDPQGALTGTASFTLYTVPADQTGTLGASSTATLTPGQNARLTFTTSSPNQTATVTFSSGSISGAFARLYNGTTLLNSAFWDPTITNDPVQATLSTPGTYTFVLDPVGDASGSMTFGLALS